MKAIEQLSLIMAAMIAAMLTAFVRPMTAVPAASAGWDEWDPFATRCSDGPGPGGRPIDGTAAARTGGAGYEWLGGLQ